MGDCSGDLGGSTVKYILVTGGLVTGIGKNVVAASIGMILRASGLGVTAIKISPCFNVSADNLDLYKHGEIFVLSDGGLVDMDMGVLERFLGVNLSSANWITSGRIYDSVFKKERNGEYSGETIELRKQVTSEITEWIRHASSMPVSADGRIPDVCIIELGGVIEDTEAKLYLEAFKKLHLQIAHDDLCCVHVGWISQPKTANGVQVKCVETSVHELQKWGLSPDIIICRSDEVADHETLARVADACLLPQSRVIGLHFLPSLYHIPIHLKNHHISKYFCERLGICEPSPRPRQLMTRWKSLASCFEREAHPVCIAIIGKYANVENSYSSLRAALEHAALACHCKLNIEWIYAEDLEPEKREKEPEIFYKAWGKACNANGILVPGGNGPRGMEGKIEVIRWAREFRKPFLGIGLGFHCAVIEYARNVLNWKDANTAEILKSSKNVIIEMPDIGKNGKEQQVKVGRKQSLFKGPKSVLQSLYGNRAMIEERHCHRYDVNPKYVADLQNAGLKFCANDATGLRMDALELPQMPFFAAVQFHPEYSSRPLRPAPPVLGLVLAASNKLEDYLSRNYILSPRYASDDECCSDDDVSLTTYGEGDIRSEYSDSPFVSGDTV